jgi:hypothetical protein
MGQHRTPNASFLHKITPAQLRYALVEARRVLPYQLPDPRQLAILDRAFAVK